MKKQALSHQFIQNVAARAPQERTLRFIGKMSDRANDGIGNIWKAQSSSEIGRAATNAIRGGEAANAALLGMGGFPANPNLGRVPMTPAFRSPSRPGMGLGAKAAIGVGGALGAYGLYKGYQHFKNKNQQHTPQQPQQMAKISSAAILAFMDEMEKISEQFELPLSSTPVPLQQAAGAFKIPLRAAQKYGPHLANQASNWAKAVPSRVANWAKAAPGRAVNWAKQQPAEVAQGLRQGAQAVASPGQAVVGGLAKRVEPLSNLASGPLTAGRLISGGLAAKGLYDSGRDLYGAVKDKQDPSGKGRSRLARGLEAGGQLAGSLAGAYAGRNLSALGGLAAGVLPQVAGTVAGRLAGTAVDRARGIRPQQQQLG